MQTQISKSTGSPSTTGRSDVAVNVLIPLPAQMSVKGSASSTSSRAVPCPWTKPCQSAATSDSFIPGLQLPANVVHRLRRDLVRDPHPRDLLLGLEHARAGEQRRPVDCALERVEPGLRERRRLSDHAVGGLRAERELEAHAPVRRRAASTAASSVRATGGRGSDSS